MKNLVFLLVLLPLLAASQRNVIRGKAVKSLDLLWDLKVLSKSPEVSWIDTVSPVRSLLYASVDYKAKATKVFPWYSNPDLLSGRKAAVKKYPAVVLVHGGGGKAYKEWVEMWAAKGYVAIAMDLSGNGADGVKLPQAGPDQDDRFKFQHIAEGNLRDMWTYHAVSSVILAHSLLLDMPEVDPAKTGINGISWGGYLTCIAASLDDRFKIAVPVYGCGYYDESDVFKKSIATLSTSDQGKWMKYFDPSSYLPYAKPKFLFINGNKDLHYNVVPYHKTYLQVPKHRRFICIKPDMLHSHVHGWEPTEIQSFFDQEFSNLTPHPSVLKVVDGQKELKLSYFSQTAITRAEFYYSNDTLATNSARKWQKINAEIPVNKKLVTVEKPEKQFRYGFFYLIDERNISISSEFIIN